MEPTRAEASSVYESSRPAGSPTIPARMVRAEKTLQPESRVAVKRAAARTFRLRCIGISPLALSWIGGCRSPHRIGGRPALLWRSDPPARIAYAARAA